MALLSICLGDFLAYCRLETKNAISRNENFLYFSCWLLRTKENAAVEASHPEEEIFRRIDEKIHEIYREIPRNWMILVFSGSGNTENYKEYFPFDARLKSKRKLCPTEWTCMDQASLENYVNMARLGMAMVALKQ